MIRSLLLFLLLTGPVTLLRSQTTSWLGTVSSSWRDSTNWNGGIPGPLTSTLVSNGSPSRHDLEVPPPDQGDTVRVGDLTIQHLGHMVFVAEPSPGVLVVHGSVLSLNGGELDLGNGRIIFQHNVRLNNGGSIDAGEGTLEFQGNVDAQSGSEFLPGTSMVIFSGDSDQTINGVLQFNNVIVETAGSLHLSGSVHMQGSLTITSGATVRIDSGASMTIDGEITGDGDIVDANVDPTTLVLGSARPQIPIGDEIHACYPNPFNPRSTLLYTLAAPGPVRITLHDLAGRLVAVLLDENRDAGDHSLSWNAEGIPSGTYFCRMVTASASRSIRLLLIR